MTTTLPYTVKPVLVTSFRPVKRRAVFHNELKANPAIIHNPEDDYKKNNMRHLQADFCFDDIWV